MSQCRSERLLVSETLSSAAFADLPKDPAILREVIIDGEWATTGGAEAEPFFICDTGSEARNHVVVYAIRLCLKHLANSTTFFMDETFSTAPNMFQQVYVIRSPLGDTAITCAYALLTCKQQTTYEELFSAIIRVSEDYGFSPDTMTIITDFKQAVLCAISNTFGQHVIPRGCYYHFTQSTWRKVQELGHARAYKQPDSQIKHWCGIIDSLAFLPVEDVAAGMNWIKQHVLEELTDLVAYFDPTYVSSSFRRTQAPPPAADGAVRSLMPSSSFPTNAVEPQ